MSDQPVQQQPLASQVPTAHTMGIREMELRARILGGSDVLMAIDRLACPVPGKESAEKMKVGMYALQKWAQSFAPDNREAALVAVGRHVRNAVDIMKKQALNKGEDN